MGIVTTIDINGGTIDGAVIGGASAAAITGTTGTFSGLISANGGITFAAGDDIAFTGSTGTNDITLTDSLADALSITRGGTDMVVFNSSTPSITFTPDVTISGNLTVNGTTTTVDTATLSVEDPLIALATGNAGADTYDIGFYGLYDTSGSLDLYAGLFRDADDSGKWKLFKDNQAAPSATAVNTSGTGYAVGTLVANLEGDVTGALTGNADTVTTNANLTGHVTSTGNAAVLGSFTKSQLSTAVSDGTPLYSGDVGTYTAGDGLDVTGGGEFSTDLVSNGGLEIQSTELSVAQGISQYDVAQFGAGVVDTDFLQIDGTSVVGKSASEVAAAIEASIDAVGTIASGTWQGNAIASTYIADAFLKNDANDTTAGTITAAGFTTGNDGVLNFSDDLPSTDHAATGVTVTITSSTTLVKGVPVYISGAGTVAACDADDVAKMPAIGINTTDLSGGAGEAEILLLGIWHDETYNFTAGADVFIGLDPASSTANSDVLGITTTAPTGSGDTVQKVGVVLTADTVFVNFTGTEILLA